jgi:hypothetical protein
LLIPTASEIAQTMENARMIGAGLKMPDRPSRRDANALPPSELRQQLLLTKAQAGALLGGMSEDWVEKHVLPHVKTLRVSRSVLIDRADLERWAQEQAGYARG